MTKITSDYLSYIFRNTTDRVPVLAESKHCEDYLKILLLRYPDKFTYYIEVHDEVADAEIFPFLIQVYVENAAKHIGIWNCMRRFQYYYGDQGEIHFSNSPLGGAVVDIHVPYKIGRSDTQE